MRDKYWRSRVVETVTIDRAPAARFHRSVQVAPLIETIRDFCPNDDLPQTARVVLPVGVLPKRTMVGFDVTSLNGSAFLLKRVEVARRQALFLRDLALEAGYSCPQEVLNFFTAMCEFPPGPWQHYRTGSWRFRSEEWRLRQYLSSGLGFPVAPHEISAWKRSADRIKSQMLYCLREDPYRDSSSENVLLALPLLASKNLVRNSTDVTEYLRCISEFVDKCARDNNSPRVLRVMAEYGKRWEVLIDCLVYLNEPTCVEMTQDIPLAIGLAGRSFVEVSFADAASNHVAIRVSDPDVELVAQTPKGPDGKKLRNRLFNLVRQSKEDFALYGSERDREERLRIRFRLTLPWISKIIISSFVGLTLLAMYLLVHLPVKTSEDLGVFVVPTTLAAGIVLSQQRTSLGMRLQRGLRFLAVISITALWALVVVAYLRGWIVGSRP